jgi:dihydroorotase
MTLVRDGVIDMARAFDLLAANPARLLGVDAGVLSVGAQADIAIIDADKPWIVDSNKMAAAAGNTPSTASQCRAACSACSRAGCGSTDTGKAPIRKDRRLSRLADRRA